MSTQSHVYNFDDLECGQKKPSQMSVSSGLLSFSASLPCDSADDWNGKRKDFRHRVYQFNVYRDYRFKINLFKVYQALLIITPLSLAVIGHHLYSLNEAKCTSEFIRINSSYHNPGARYYMCSRYHRYGILTPWFSLIPSLLLASPVLISPQFCFRHYYPFGQFTGVCLVRQKRVSFRFQSVEASPELFNAVTRMANRAVMYLLNVALAALDVWGIVTILWTISIS